MNWLKRNRRLIAREAFIMVLLIAASGFTGGGIAGFIAVGLGYTAGWWARRSDAPEPARLWRVHKHLLRVSETLALAYWLELRDLPDTEDRMKARGSIRRVLANIDTERGLFGEFREPAESQRLREWRKGLGV